MRHDPRSRQQRRADALGALAAGADRLGCRCGRADCAAGPPPAATPVVVHVLAEQPGADAPGSLVAADGLIPPEMVEELAKSAKLIPVVHPGDAVPERGYVQSKALADFVRCRDVTCRWPGCDKPAFECDVDHTIPYAQGGPTHASNVRCRESTLLRYRLAPLAPVVVYPRSSADVGANTWWRKRLKDYERAPRGWAAPNQSTSRRIYAAAAHTVVTPRPTLPTRLPSAAASATTNPLRVPPAGTPGSINPKRRGASQHDPVAAPVR